MTGGAVYVSMPAVGRLGRRCPAAGTDLGSSVFVLTDLLGYPNVRTYDGSWTAWGSLFGAPIER